MTHILLVEDEVKLARFLELELNYQGYQVSVAYDGLTAMIAARQLQLDLIILDGKIPGLSAWEICHRLGNSAKNIPIILLTAKDEVTSRIAGLDASTADYVVKPFNIEELLAKVCTHLRKTQQADAADK
ncbi:response regulator transcription factor [Anabaena sp. FACHB-709]|uniref:Two-component response regulator n=2 Tax=Nostocaceae TaxID=1162 RepID=A0A1Z4KRZ8_ANAVA|nr:MULTISPECIES: response regulator transcription factor [Nostocaceae]BAY71749.1 two-component response regulator [Trichormus variabilis NIES-23]HBW33656.1 DNA-binding response regulator [Nostoc sp. UBA8866]MBD2172344.1 response regulator transcription factor [Anabaena cylindrica FACHB-318]MBD2263835.1 response regulator transcription factor [Anabaena sp. FACHB-709]MBD2273284.1 response regulator transcription factor [Nostoc sp. PCC 7120 = FACHB-418]